MTHSTTIRTFCPPFSKYDASKKVKDAIDDAVKNKQIPPLSQITEKVDNYLASRFPTDKSCESEISYSIDGNAELGVNLSSIISPVEAQLGVTAKGSATIRYPQGDAFRVFRVIRDSRTFQIKREVVRDKCGESPSSIKTAITGNDGIDGEVTASDLQAAGLTNEDNGFPVYHCRQEFLAIEAILTNKYALPTDIARFAIANVAEFKGAKDPAICSSPAKD